MASGVPNEFKLIARHFAPLSLGFSGAYELRDDAAVISPAPGFELVVKTDAIVGGIDFPLDEPADLVARKALRVNLSDLAAKGAVPRAYLVDLILPDTIGEAWIAAFAAVRSSSRQRGGRTFRASLSCDLCIQLICIRALREFFSLLTNAC